MQLNKLSPLAVAILATLLSACGGGGEDAPPPSAPPVINVSAIKVNSATPANAKVPVQFDGGECSGGTGTLTPSRDYGDSTGPSTSNTHTYETDGTKTVTITCTDSTGKTGVRVQPVTIASAAMNGFLGKNWTTYAAIESNVLPYPVAGLTSGGDIYGVWIRRTVTTPNEVATGTTNFSSTSWTVSTDVLDTGTDRSPFNVITPGMSTAAIDLAVSPNGHAIAAWTAVSPTNVKSIWYTTKAGLSDAWATPQQIAEPLVADQTIKVVVNDDGESAIAYCSISSTTVNATGTGAEVKTTSVTNTETTTTTTPAGPGPVITTITTTSAKLITDPANPSPVAIGNTCGETSATQRMRAFDIAIDSTTVYAVGIGNGTASPNRVVNLHSCTIGGACAATPQAISGQLTDAPKSLSFSRSPNGNYAAIAWNQIRTESTGPVSDVYARIYAPGTPTGIWGVAMPVQIDVLNDNYTHPLVAINDSGDAFLVMQRAYNLGYSFNTVVTNYNAATQTWRKPFKIADQGLSATDIAIDKWGTGLLTHFGADNTGNQHSQVGTLTKSGSWSNLTSLTYKNYPANTFHYQTMRALPDGRAILTTSVYDTTPSSINTSPVLSGYMLLK